jgi:hypothetical protein
MTAKKVRPTSVDDVEITLRLRKESLKRLTVVDRGDVVGVNLGAVGLVQEDDGVYALWVGNPTALPKSVDG